MLNFLDSVIAGGFYLLFFLVPLFFSASTSELFEYNKMMLTYGLTVIIVGAWITKMAVTKKWLYRHTFLEIPLVLYLGSHLLSTIFSIDPHVSVWGYYSRFHEGLLASLSYILLYFAVVSNLNADKVKKIFYVSFASGVIVSVWGILEHFGHSPSCLLITGNFGVDCWIQDVKNAVYATLGQRNWMAAYLDILILAVLAFRGRLSLLSILFFTALLFTKSRSGVLGLMAGFGVYGLSYWKNLKSLRNLGKIAAGFALIIFLFGLPFAQIEKFSLETWLNQKSAASVPVKPVSPDLLISESGDIRRVVWKGAVKVWERYPILGSGVETFAYAYYKDRPVEHNLLSEWDFLYNKAHNEYLNLLATTGTLGIITYAIIILAFGKFLISNFKFLNSLQATLFAAWVSILVTNFFGFSVVIIGLYFFLIPAFCYLLAQDSEQLNSEARKQSGLGAGQWGLVFAIGIIGLLMELSLWNMWNADRDYAYGKNLSSVQQFVSANPFLTSAVAANPDEPTFRDELAYNQAVLASALFDQIKDSSESAVASLSAEQKLNVQSPELGASVSDLVNQAIANSDKAVTTSPDSLPFWKGRTKTFYQLSLVNEQYFTQAIDALRKAVVLAPTDAKVHYNLGLLLGRGGSLSEGIKILEETLVLKPDYRDAYYTLGLFYSATGDKAKAREMMELVIKKFGQDKDALQWLTENP